MLLRTLPILLLAALLSACNTLQGPSSPPPEIRADEVTTLLTAARTSNDPSILHVHLAGDLSSAEGPLDYVAELQDADGQPLATVPLERARPSTRVRPVGVSGTWAYVRMPDGLQVQRIRIAPR